MLFNIYKHQIDTAIAAETKNYGGEIKPKYLMLHATSMNVDELSEEFGQEEAKESCHLALDSEGTITQFLPFNVKAWHAGASYWQGHHGLNGFAIGVYLCDWRGYCTKEQKHVLDELIPTLVAEYNLRDIICLPRPGAPTVDVSPWSIFVDYGNAESIGRYVSTMIMDIYGGPSPHYRILDELRAGEAVKVLRRSADGEWYFILYERDDHVMRYGWAHESFFRRL
jgi:hypothetical protein